MSTKKNRTGALWLMLLVVGLGSSPLGAVPNSIFGPIVQADSPLNGQELSEEVLAAAAGGAELPGEWVEEGRIAGSRVSHLLARPKLFGQEVVILRAVHRDKTLERVEATFADAGSYFGYFDEELPEGLSRREAEEELNRRMAAKQTEFTELYADRLAALRVALSSSADREKPKVIRFGHTRTLRAEPEEWRKGELVLRLFAADDRLVRLTISPEDAATEGWMDATMAGMSKGERVARLASMVKTSDEGVVSIEGLEPVPQGYRPYCGLNALAMAARHFGLYLDEDWMAAAAGFRNTGSADGSNMVKLYHAVAAEAGLSLDRANRLDPAAVKRALAAGMPVVVWRRFSWDRNRLHDQVARGRAELPDPKLPAEKASWPGKDAPLHASLLTGFDPNRNEVLFLESWSGRDKPRRMRFEEMEATSYLCFVFRR